MSEPSPLRIEFVSAVISLMMPRLLSVLVGNQLGLAGAGVISGGSSATLAGWRTSWSSRGTALADVSVIAVSTMASEALPRIMVHVAVVGAGRWWS